MIDGCSEGKRLEAAAETTVEVSIVAGVAVVLLLVFRSESDMSASGCVVAPVAGLLSVLLLLALGSEMVLPLAIVAEFPAGRTLGELGVPVAAAVGAIVVALLQFVDCAV